ncbi:tetratricopeptide repeat protein, partial [Nostoc sp. 'Peltigera malacea cyanobiont' DB3992]|uniref:tetratricopeptide repeat protein n=1 Tax=Nostoc sp. 'Peltigera malacea cyanobiont' DB3992 TaxID=1206980 RepID=UPI00211EFFC5
MTKPNRGVLFLQALGQRKRLLEVKHPFVTTSVKELARLYYYQGRYDQAEELLVEALEQKLLKKNILL